MPKSGTAEQKSKTGSRRQTAKQDGRPGSTTQASSQEATPGHRRGRTHDAEGTREVILNAGEKVFAEHGFDGARIDAIAGESGYNKSLIFQYFGDKLGLYAAVVRRADDQTREMQNQALVTIREAVPNPRELKSLMREYVGKYFDYLVQHPNILRMFNWEMAEGWQTFSKILTDRDYQDIDDFAPIFLRLQKTGVMRAKPEAFLQFTTALFTCHTVLAIVPLYRTLLSEDELDSPAELAATREFVMDFATNGLLNLPMEAHR